MLDQDHKQFTVLVTLVAILLMAVILQSIAIFGLHKKLGQSVARAEKSGAAAVNSTPSLSNALAVLPQSLDIDKDPWGWNPGDGDPFKEMHAMQDRINQMFGSAFNRFQQSDDFGHLPGSYTFSPDINIEDKGGHYLVTVDLPGIEDSQLSVNIEGKTLIISGRVQSESKEEHKGKILRQERRSGKFQRSVILPSPVQPEKMTIANKQGIVTITIPKADK